MRICQFEPQDFFDSMAAATAGYGTETAGAAPAEASIFLVRSLIFAAVGTLVSI